MDADSCDLFFFSPAYPQFMDQTSGS